LDKIISLLEGAVGCIKVFQDIPNSKTYKVDLQGKLTELNVNAKRASGTSFGKDGSRYVIAGATKQVIAYDAAGHETIIADSISGNDIVVANNGNVYVTSPDGTEKPSKLYLIRPGGGKEVVDEGIRFANGLTLSPIKPNCMLLNLLLTGFGSARSSLTANGFKQHYGWLHVRDQDENAWSDGSVAIQAGYMLQQKWDCKYSIRPAG
jgi:hypothetical protein